MSAQPTASAGHQDEVEGTQATPGDGQPLPPPPSPERVHKRLKTAGVLLSGHFALTSGRHSPTFLQCSQILQHPAAAETVGSWLAAAYEERLAEADSEPPAAVAGPAVGAILLAHVTARRLEARSLFTEKEDGRMVLRRGFELQPRERVLLVEDAVTTGDSVRRTTRTLTAAGADVVGIVAVVDRSGGKARFGAPFTALLSLDIADYPAADCPLCAQGLPLTQPKQADG